MVAFVIRAVLWLVPVQMGLLACYLARRWMHPAFESPIGRFLWFVEMFGLASAVTALTARAVDRFLPLSTLCLVNLEFPEAAPNRMRTALRLGNAKSAALVADFQANRVAASPQKAAEQVLGLVEALNRHDRRTRGHSEKVRAYAEVIAVELGLSERDRNLLRWGALLHDIGKLVVPSEILNKQGAPDAAEWAILRTHPDAAVERIGPLREWLGEWALAASQHHERYDGTGYPRASPGSRSRSPDASWPSPTPSK